MPYICLKTQNRSLGVHTLLPVRKEDMQQIRIWRNEQIMVLRQKNFISAEEQENYFTNTVEPGFTLPHPQNILFSFLEEEALIGYGALVHIDWKRRSAEISFLIETKRIGKDDEVPRALSQLVHLLLQAAFHDLQLNKITAEVYDWGMQRRTALEEAGFQFTHKTENTKVINGKAVGSLHYSLKRSKGLKVLNDFPAS